MVFAMITKINKILWVFQCTKLIKVGLKRFAEGDSVMASFFWELFLVLWFGVSILCFYFVFLVVLSGVTLPLLIVSPSPWWSVHILFSLTCVLCVYKSTCPSLWFCQFVASPMRLCSDPKTNVFLNVSCANRDRFHGKNSNVCFRWNAETDCKCVKTHCLKLKVTMMLRPS